MRGIGRQRTNGADVWVLNYVFEQVESEVRGGDEEHEESYEEEGEASAGVADALAAE